MFITFPNETLVKESLADSVTRMLVEHAVYNKYSNAQSLNNLLYKQAMELRT